MSRILKPLTLTILAVFAMITAYAATAFASTEVVNDDASILDLLRPVYDAFAGGRYALGACALVILVVALAKRYGTTRVPFLASAAGTALLTLFAATAGALATALGAPDATVTLALMKSALLIGFGAAGGYMMIKAVIVEPILRPLAAKAPKWLQPIFALIFYVFDKAPATQRAQAVAKSKAAGDAAVLAQPAQGVSSVVGNSTEIQ